MKNFILLLILLPLSSIYAQNLDSTWTKEKRIKYLENRQNSETWDMKMFKDDKESIPKIPKEMYGFMNMGAFPVSEYNVLGKGTWTGTASMGTFFMPAQVKDKKVAFGSLSYTKNRYSKGLEGLKDDVFFTIITVVDTIDMENYTTSRMGILSRNSPDIIGQGFVKNKNSQIDFLAFKVIEGNSYAIVNMRIFDLTYGNIIVIAPQKDGTFRSMQLKEVAKNKDEMKDFIEKDILKRKEIVEFLTNESVI